MKVVIAKTNRYVVTRYDNAHECCSDTKMLRFRVYPCSFPPPSFFSSSLCSSHRSSFRVCVRLSTSLGRATCCTNAREHVGETKSYRKTSNVNISQLVALSLLWRNKSVRRGGPWCARNAVLEAKCIVE